MASIPLRPMSTGEILDASFALLRRHAGVFFGVAIVCQGPPTALQLFVQFGGGVGAHFGLFVFARVLNGLGYLLITAACIRVVSQAYLGQEPGMGEALAFAWQRVWRTLSAALSAVFLATLAAFLLVVPGIIVACGFAVAVQAAVLESLHSGSDGLGRSWVLTRGYKWKAFGLYVVVGIIATIVLFGLSVVGAIATALFPPLLVPVVVSFALVFLFAYPFVSCVFTLFYYDLRVRREAFDLELLGRHLGVAVAPV